MEVGNLTHSHSQPGEMDRTPPGTPKKGGKMLAVRVQMLDDTVTMFQIQAKALGRVLFDQVCNQLNLLESDYFGLEYQEAGGTKYWLDLEKPVCRQIGLSLVDILVRFCVKFYTPDPSQLEEEFTRYLFCLQIKRDLSQGLLQCNSNTAALMASYIVQAECGDYVVEDYPDHRYLSTYKFVPNQDQELERRIMENHKKHAGQSPAEADLNLLETARRCELYGIKMHPAKDHEGCPLNLAVAHMGIVVFQNYSKINTFSWAKIRKISFKRKRFLVKLHPEGYGYYKDTVEFFFEGRNECKNFWKKCVENHGFFRCTMVKKVPRQKTRVLSRGSSFRYSGRTQKQIVDFVRENYVKRQTFQRSQSFRHSSSAHSSVANVGTSISAHPLLPLGDNAVVGTPASLSCGSMTLTSSPVHTADIHTGASPSPPLTTSASPGTSVTSSPQHVYHQETPYRRTGHRPTKVKLPPMRSHHAISPLSPIDAATDVGNRSASRSNVGLDARDVISSRNSLKSPEFIDFNDIYSNCYTSLRSLRNELEDERVLDERTKIGIFDLTCDFSNDGNSKSRDSVESQVKKSKDAFSENVEDSNRYTWHRSASCKDLYCEGESDKNIDVEAISPSGRPDRSRRKCYSAVASKSASVERGTEGGGDMRIYSSSYPGTTSSLSTESVECELEDRIAEVLDVKYDSQEEIALSHDDVSHDSYELLERELDERNEHTGRGRGRLMVRESERTRSCSWGSDRGMSLLDFRSTESGIGSGCDVSREQNLWSLDIEKNSKHRSESDFRNLGNICSKEFRLTTKEAGGRYYDSVARHEKREDFLNYDDRFGNSSREISEELQRTIFRKNLLEGRMPTAKESMGDKESFRDVNQDVELRRLKRVGEENLDEFEKQKYHTARKSVEELADFCIDSVESSKEFPVRIEERRRMEKRREKKERDERFHEGLKEKEEKELEIERERERERERGRKHLNRRKSVEGKEELDAVEEVSRKIMTKPSDYGNFQEIHFKKFDRVVSNQFGRYSEFLTQENTFFAQGKVLENHNNLCEMNRIMTDLENSFPADSLPDNCAEVIESLNLKGLSTFGEPVEFKECKKAALDHSGPAGSPRRNTRVGRALVERTKSDPYNSMKSYRRNILMHQKSIDLTPQHSEETTSDFDSEEAFKKASRSEHDIPYILHKRHCMNGTAKNTDLMFVKANLKTSVDHKVANSSNGGVKISRSVVNARKSVTEDKKLNFETVTSFKQRPSSAKVAEAKKAGVQIINLDVKKEKAVVNIAESKVANKSLKVPLAKKSSTEDGKTAAKTTTRKEVKNTERSSEQVGPLTKAKKELVNVEKSGKIFEESVSHDRQNEEPIYAEVCQEKSLLDDESLFFQKKPPPHPPKRTSSSFQKPPTELKASIKMEEEGEEAGGSDSGSGSVSGRGRVEAGSGVHRRREESQTLFARTRLGVSEGSAFAAIVREGGTRSPGFQRRTKSLDAPYVSVHSLPPANAFSSKDDTVEGNEGDIVSSAVTRIKEFRKGEVKKNGITKNEDGRMVFDLCGNTESEVDSVFTDDLEMESTFKKTVENQSKVDICFPDEKVLDGVRGKRLLSKIESVDFIDSEGDLDSSKLAEPPVIPSDRLVNLPESIRFPSVRQISGQTSEESADGWDQKEVKVKRRTPRRSVGREDQDIRVDIPKESVVWDSKDEEVPDDDVWDARKYEGVVVNVGLPTEYLKRGSCGQSIDDDNLSTPMKESSPEHWVSVDDLPEALEREEKLLKQQEKILREKILNEKLKRELNLDTIDIDERYCDYKNNIRSCKYEEELMSLKENFKGHSLDTYELNEKKSRERRGNKNSTSLDEDLLPNRFIQGHASLDTAERIPTKGPAYGESLDYIQCKVVKDVAEIEQFGDNDEEVEEFFVVLDENLEREGRSVIWGDDESLKRTLSNDESLISVPEEFKDAEKDIEEMPCGGGKVEIRLSEAGGMGEEVADSIDDRMTSSSDNLILIENWKGGDVLFEKRPLCFAEGGGFEDARAGPSGDLGGLSPFGGSRRGSEGGREENRKVSISEDTGRLSPYDGSSRRGSDELRRPSTSEDAGRLSPFTDSRRGSEDPRRLSTSEDSRKCSVSESVSEETRRRLSSTEETRRKRASLTKQCSVGAESLSDEVISGIQECSSSFEQDEKDVFEPEPVILRRDEELGTPRVKLLEVDESEMSSEATKIEEPVNFVEKVQQASVNTVHLAPPSSEREMSRETEDSMDYGEGEFKDIRDTVKEKDLPVELISDEQSLMQESEKLVNVPDTMELTENDELRFIDEKRGSTPEIIIGKSREAVNMAIVVVNEGISVLNKINHLDRKLDGDVESEPLPKIPTLSFICHDQRHTLPKSISKPKPLTPKPLEYAHRKIMKNVPDVKVMVISSPVTKESSNLLRSSLDSSQESDLDRLSDLSLVSYVQNQIARRNLSDAGKCLRREDIGAVLSGDSGSWKTSSEEDAILMNQKTSSEEKEKTDQSSADELVTGEKVRRKEVKGERTLLGKAGLESSRGKRERIYDAGKDKRNLDQEKRDSGEDGSSSSSAPLCPKRELSSTWKPFLLESSGSSSLEEGWLPPDENAHLADEEETSSTSNNQQDDSYHDDMDYPTGIGYPVLNVTSAEMIVSGYGSVYALSRTLSRISERSMSEQERSDMEDDLTKPSTHSMSVEEESILSSDHQPSLSSDPPSPKESASVIPDLPVDRPLSQFSGALGDESPVCEPFGDVIPPPAPEEDWPSPPSSSSVMDTPVISHVETFYMEIHPEEACKVVVAGSRDEGSSSSDENQTLQEESEFLVLSSDNLSVSTTTTTQDGTVVIPVRPTKSSMRGSLSEDASMISTSEWSGHACANEEAPSLERQENKGEISHWIVSSSKYVSEKESQKSKMSTKIKPLKLSSPTGKTFGFFETPVSKVRSPTSQMKFFESGDRGTSGNSSLRSPTSFSEIASPKSFFEGSSAQAKTEAFEHRITRSPSKVKGAQRPVYSTYYSNVADCAEKSYFGRYDTGSLERTKIQSSRKYASYYSVSRTAPSEGDGSNSDGPPTPSPNTIPRASKKTRRRHRVAMDLVVRDGRIIAPPKTNATVLENSDSDRSSPKLDKDVSDASVDMKENNVFSSTPLQNGKMNGEVSRGGETMSGKSSMPAPLRNRIGNSGERDDVGSESGSKRPNSSELQTKEVDPCLGRHTLDSKLTMDGNRNALDESLGESDTKKKRYSADKGYFIMKELLSTERTYKKDLDVINSLFHEEMSKSEEEMPDDVLNGLFNLFDPLCAAHSQFLRELEQRLATWEGKNNPLAKRDVHKIGDVILMHFNVLPLYVKYVDKHLLVLERLDAAFRKNKKFEQVYREFELQRACYLPLSSFIMKPLQRVLHYNSLLKRLIKYYGAENIDCRDFVSAQSKLEPIASSVPAVLKTSANFIQLSELQRDMPSFEGLLQGGRELIRQGCLLKHSKKGFQQRMFFLFSDILVYTNRTTSPSLQFKVNGQMPLRGVMVEESEDRIGTNFSFTIYGGNRTLLVAASSQEEKDKWLQDLFEAIQNARDRNDGKMLQYLSLKSCSSSDEIMDTVGEDGNLTRNRNSQQRSNTTVHVCWHRNTSTSLQDHLRAFENELSGFLLRKFKNSNGWQKLWVVFTNFCLFFYKAYLDESPLACLPLLGYSVTVPDDQDDIRKDYVFKLQFKNHVYFFRAESDYTFSRWMEVISSATNYFGANKNLA